VEAQQLAAIPFAVLPSRGVAAVTAVTRRKISAFWIAKARRAGPRTQRRQLSAWLTARSPASGLRAAGARSPMKAEAPLGMGMTVAVEPLLLWL
jgi:hypothetical protein